MKIIQLIPSLAGGGAERFVLDLCNELVKTNEVVLITFYDFTANDIFRNLLNSNIKTISLGKRTGFDYKIIGKLYKAIESVSPDIIHTHVRGLTYLYPLLPFLKNFPIVHTIHNDAFEECPSRIIRIFRSFAFRFKSIEPIVISKAGAESFQKAYKNKRYHLIYNGREKPEKSILFSEVVKEINHLKLNVNTKVFINIGRLVDQKNQIMLVDAFNKLILDNKINAILLIIGKERNTETSIRIKKKLDSKIRRSKNVFLLGERENATDYLFISDFFCLSSKYEGMPISLIEAFATGNIPICTPVGGILEMMSELSSMLIADKIDTSDYHRALKHAYSLKKEEQEILKTKVKKLYSKNYSIKKCTETHLKIYHQILSRKTGQ